MLVTQSASSARYLLRSVSNCPDFSAIAQVCGLLPRYFWQLPRSVGNCPNIFGNCPGLWAIAQIFWQLPRSVGNCPFFLAIARFVWAIAQFCPVLPGSAQILGAAVSHSPRQNSLISRYAPERGVPRLCQAWARGPPETQDL